MGLQKFRADKAGEKQSNGAIPFYAHWIGGPSLALIRNCPVNNATIGPRTVYIRGEADTMFTQPAACTYRKKTIRGYVTCDKNNELVFHALTFIEG
jgi:hypothetical protein